MHVRSPMQASQELAGGARNRGVFWLTRKGKGESTVKVKEHKAWRGETRKGARVCTCCMRHAHICMQHACMAWCIEDRIVHSLSPCSDGEGGDGQGRAMDVLRGPSGPLCREPSALATGDGLTSSIFSFSIFLPFSHPQVDGSYSLASSKLQAPSS